MEPNTLYLLYLGSGLLIGGLSAWLVAKFRFAATKLTPDAIRQEYIRRELHENLQEQADLMREDLKEKESELRQLEGALSANREQVRQLEQRLARQLEEFEQLQNRSQAHFENVANRLLEEKSRKFAEQNQTQLQDILQPLREKIKEFEEGVERKFVEDAKEKLSLKLAIDQLRELNTQLSDDANKLVNALKGDNKTQGDWGEYQLEMLLRKAGLEAEVHYRAQPNFKDEDGQDKRPDFVVYLPEERHLIIDCKVSLVAYERFFSAETPEDQARHLKAHVESVRQHVRNLSEKNYQLLSQLNAPDYLLLFIPIEPAFSTAMREDSRLFLDALDRNVVLVTASTLLATMRTVSYIWKQEKQKRSVLEIARQSGLLYDRFVNFVEDLKTVGQKLDGAQLAYQGAMQKLAQGKRYGDTLIGRAEKIRKLGAKSAKLLPRELVDSAGEDEEAESGTGELLTDQSGE